MTGHVIHIENTYKTKDGITEDEIDRFIIKLRDDSSDTDTSLVVEYLDSDFEY